MKAVALTLSLLGGLAGLALWTLEIEQNCCVQPRPSTATMLPSLGSSLPEFPDEAVPLAALAAMIIAVLAIFPRFQRKGLARGEILCGLLLAVLHVVFSVARGWPFPLAVAPGILVLAGGVLVNRRLTRHMP